MPPESKLGIILNPAAGRGRAAHAVRSIVTHLQNKKIPFQMERTNGPGHAREIAGQMKNIFDIVIAAGGDGTVNEVVGGIFGGKSALALLPVGSGNDFSRIIGMPRGIEKNIDAILHGERKPVDLGTILFWNSKGEKKKLYFVNTLGIGLDAEIADETKRIKSLRGLPLYLTAALKAICRHSPNEYRIFTETERTVERAFMVCVGNGSHEGGGFNLLPEASVHDSMLDMCLIRAMPVIKALSLIPKLVKGTHCGEKKISILRSKKFSIKSKYPFLLHSDGEVVSSDAIRADIELEKEKLSVIFP
jgi:diacylglycerol kinase (ATP)